MSKRDVDIDMDDDMDAEDRKDSNQAIERIRSEIKLAQSSLRFLKNRIDELEAKVIEKQNRIGMSMRFCKTGAQAIRTKLLAAIASHAEVEEGLSASMHKLGHDSSLDNGDSEMLRSMSHVPRVFDHVTVLASEMDPSPPWIVPKSRQFYETDPPKLSDLPLPTLDPNWYGQYPTWYTQDSQFVIHIMPRASNDMTTTMGDIGNSMTAAAAATADPRLMLLNVKVRANTKWEKVFQAYLYKINSTAEQEHKANPSTSSKRPLEPLSLDMLEFRLRTYQEPSQGHELGREGNLMDFFLQGMDIVSPPPPPPPSSSATPATKNDTATKDDRMLLVWVSVKPQQRALQPLPKSKSTTGSSTATTPTKPKGGKGKKK
ncbi:hypothetical protein OIO90_002831 [Microbotryomycetes sp. JL221]|nr:hypothetical protein OIO90_002831 [Microbotryomycetes sp. JL221]